MNWIKLTFKRLGSKSPEYFVKLQVTLGVIGAMATSIVTTNNLYNLNLDEGFIKVCGYVIVACGAMIVGFQATTKNKELSEK